MRHERTKGVWTDSVLESQGCNHKLWKALGLSNLAPKRTHRLVVPTNGYEHFVAHGNAHTLRLSASELTRRLHNALAERLAAVPHPMHAEFQEVIAETVRELEANGFRGSASPTAPQPLDNEVLEL